MALSFMHDDRVAYLDIVLFVGIVAFVTSPASKLSATIHHLQYTASHRVFPPLRQTEREAETECKV